MGTNTHDDNVTIYTHLSVISSSTGPHSWSHPVVAICEDLMNITNKDGPDMIQ